MSLLMDPPAPINDRAHSPALSIIGTVGQLADRARLDTHGQFVRVTVNNNGQTDISNVFVQYWVCAFNAGYSKKLFLPSASGTVGRQIPASAPSNFTVQRGVQLAFQDPNEWFPTTAELDNAGLRDPNDPDAPIHSCLLANVFSPGVDGAQLTAEPPVLDLNDNPHHAQRNIALFYAPGQVVPPVPMNVFMHVGNRDSESEHTFQLTLHEAHLRMDDLEPIVIDHLLRNERIERIDEPLAGDGVKGLALRVNGELQPIRLARAPLDDLRIEAGEVCEPEPKIALEPDGFLGIRLLATLPEDEQGANVLRILDLVQTLDGKHVGDARVLFLDAPAEDERESKPAYAG